MDFDDTVRERESPRVESLHRLESIGTIDRPPSSLSPPHPSKIWNPFSIHVLALLIPSSVFGALARLGLRALGSYSGRSTFPLAYAQGLGCLIIGFTMPLKDSFGYFYPPLYTAIATGFCGSLTTFSGWQLDIFNSWINAGHFHRDGLRDFMDGLGNSVFTLSISFASVSFGTLLAYHAHPLLPTLRHPTRTVRYTITILSLLTYGAVVILYFLLPFDYRHQATAALLFAFPGTLTRYVLSVHLNPLLKSLPLGTLLANSFGTALLAAIVVLQSKINPVSPGACDILQGLSDGYCGCLTTVSTFAVEIYAMTLGKGFRYAFLSWSMGQLVLVAILGSSIWSGHAREQITC